MNLLRVLKLTLLKQTAGLRRSTRGLGLQRLPFIAFLYRSAYAWLAGGSDALVSPNGIPMYVHVGDVGVGKQLFLDGQFEPSETRLVERLLRPGMVVVDIGAHVGYYSLLAAKAVGDTGKVFSFEPEPRNFALLQRNIELNGLQNVTAVRKGVSDRTGPMELHVDRVNQGGHSLYQLGEGTESIVIDLTSLDDYFADIDLTVDFIKMDIQQAEPLAFKGMGELLKRQKAVRILTEIEPPELRKSGIDPQEFLDNLCKLGFRLFSVDGDDVKPTDPTQIIDSYSTDKRNILCERL